MKKLFVLILLLISSSSEIVFAQNGGGKPKIILTPFPGTSSDPTGQYEWPTVSAEYDNEELTISISNFSGDASISIYRTPGHTLVYNDTIYLSDFNPVDIDISSLTTGTYTLIIMLDSGEMLSGNFELEE